MNTFVKVPIIISWKNYSKSINLICLKINLLTCLLQGCFILELVLRVFHCVIHRLLVLICFQVLAYSKELHFIKLVGALLVYFRLFLPLDNN